MWHCLRSYSTVAEILICNISQVSRNAERQQFFLPPGLIFFDILRVAGQKQKAPKGLGCVMWGIHHIHWLIQSTTVLFCLSVRLSVCCFSDLVLTHCAVLTLSSEAEHSEVFKPFASKSNNTLFVPHKQRNAAIPHSTANKDSSSANHGNN